ncbi:MAG: hypothetical protein QOF98_3507 [Streptomyces sp.]|nr:hypothetical protein [Streptomyces sp.]
MPEAENRGADQTRSAARRTRDDRNRDGRSRTDRPTRSAGRSRYRRALRREAPVIVGLLLDEQDFAVMTGYPSFPFDDYGHYLQHLDGLLHSLYTQGIHVAITLFDPDAYDHFCRSTRQPPDSPPARTRYTAEATTNGPAVRYTGQSMALLRSELAREADRRATWERATDALMDAGPCPDCGQDLAHCAFDRASHTLLRVIEAVGSGSHHVVCSLPTDDGPPLLAAVHVDADGDGEVQIAEPDALVVCTIMAASTLTAHPGGLVIRTSAPDRPETVRGWSLRSGEPHPLTAAEVFNAYCTDPATGEPIPPEPNVTYEAGLPLPPPLPGDLQ